ncbi:MAG: hypothetical protein ACLQNE_04655 [Thermoguttaceae bacterium]|jgi:hypothetical protein
MSNTQSPAEALNRLHAENAAIEEAVQEAVNEAVLAHKRLGLPMVTWRDGHVVWIPADQLTVPGDTARL